MVALACHELGPRAGDQARRPAGAGGRLPRLLRHPVGVRRHHRRVDGRPPGPDAHHRRRAGHRAGAGRRRRARRRCSCPRPAPWTFKLAFAWYLNALFNLNPFLALDGYYLLMDWLEVPNLRARGLAWVVGPAAPPAAALVASSTARAGWSRCTACSPCVWLVDRGQPRLPDLHRPGRRAGHRAVALRLAGPAAAGRGGLPASPRRWSTSPSAGSPARCARAAPAARRAPRRAGRAAPARRAARLGARPACPPHALAELADAAALGAPAHRRAARLRRRRPAARVRGRRRRRWRRRRPGDPSGTVRERVGAGGVVGLASALTGAPAALAWHTAGTTLLAVPSSAVAAAVGPLPGPPPAELGRGGGAARRGARAAGAQRRGPAGPDLRRPAGQPAARARRSCCNGPTTPWSSRPASSRCRTAPNCAAAR